LTARSRIIAETLLASLLAAALIWPIFKTKYYENWYTIDSTFIADGRFLSENLPHPGWQPLWYGGTRFDYVYPPALRYGTALLTRYTPFSPARAYHFYTALLYSLGIGFVLLLVRTASNSRAAAWWSATAAATLSPAMLLMHHIREDVTPYMPQRLNVLVRYGEGPHMSALALIPLALALAWHGLRPGKAHWIAAAAAACALVVSNNFYGATSLAIFFPVLCWAIFAETRDPKVFLRGAATAALAYALCAIWLTPSFLQITSRNLALVSQPGNTWSAVLAAVAAALFAALSWRAARRGAGAWPIFVCGALLFFSLNVLGQYYFKFRIAGEPERLVPELDLATVLFAGLLFQQAWQRSTSRAATVLLVLAAVIPFLPATPYLSNPWHPIVRTSQYEHRLEYQLAQWVDQHRPGTRSYVHGTVRFWWNVWFNQAQIGGGSEQGMGNFSLPNLYWITVLGTDPTLDIRWMQAYGVDNILVNDKTSELPITDIEHPHKYQGVLKPLFEDGKGNWVYEIPRKHPGLARIVDASLYAGLRPAINGDDMEAVNPYVHLLEDSAPAAASSRWLSSRAMEIEAETSAGQAIAVQVTHDPYWIATENGARYPVAPDAFGQMRIDVPPGRHKIHFEFVTPLENRVGFVVTLAGLALAFFLMARRALARREP
jgi:hypothetical protein